MYGPNTNGKAGGPCAWGEMQVRYAMQAIERIADGELQSLEVKEDIYDRFNADLDARAGSLIWMAPGQKSYYINEFGRSATNGVWLNSEYWSWTRELNLDDFIVREPDDRQPAGTTAGEGDA
jgi:4-hydroxyacetophenone monooxygenase